jgi:nucleoside-diphosphate-sugar epimerase
LHLVTGGSGFLGSLIVKRLLALGYPVRVLDLWDDPNRPKEVEFHRADIRDRTAVAAAMRRVEVVHHNVALVPLTKSGDEFWSVNVVGTTIAAEEAAKASVGTFVNMSSSSVFGVPDKLPITNSTPLHPGEKYGRAKLAAELEANRVATETGLRLITIRPRTILGQGRLGIFQLLFEWISEGRNVYVLGSGKNLYQFIHASDLIDAYMMVLASGKTGTYNVGTDRFDSMRGTLESLIQHAGGPSKVRSLPTGLAVPSLKILDRLHLIPLAPYHYLVYQRDVYFDITSLLELGWRPCYSNAEMFAESYDWYIENRARSPEGVSAATHRMPVRQGALRILKWLS